MGSASQHSLPTLRWGIIGTGLISSWFVKDLAVPRSDARAHHIVTAIGSSSLQKGQDFVSSHLAKQNPTVYGSYDEVYSSSDVDIVYIGTPHAFHKKNCLDAIRAHKHVLCEKAFTITAKEAAEVLAAAKEEGVFIMEAMWTRFNAVVLELRKKIFEDKVIGEVKRTFCDFGLEMNIAELGPDSRLKNPKLGAGSLLDIGIYSLTWGLLTLDQAIGDEAEEMQVLGAQSLNDGIDTTSTIVLKYPKSGKQGILTSTTEFKTRQVFCRVEGTEGYIEVYGPGASAPTGFTVHKKQVASATGDPSVSAMDTPPEVYATDKQGFGFYWEADAVALDIAAGRLENHIMPHAETMRVMKILDEVRRQGGARFPQDDE